MVGISGKLYDKFPPLRTIVTNPLKRLMKIRIQMAQYWGQITIQGKILAGEKLTNHGLLAKIFLANNIHGYTESVFGICTD